MTGLSSLENREIGSPPRVYSNIINAYDTYLRVQNESHLGISRQDGFYVCGFSHISVYQLLLPLQKNYGEFPPTVELKYYYFSDYRALSGAGNLIRVHNNLLGVYTSKSDGFFFCLPKKKTCGHDDGITTRAKRLRTYTHARAANDKP